MELLKWIMYYLATSASLALTSYFVLYRPAIKLLEEILQERSENYRGIRGFILWQLVATVFSPYVLLLLVKNDNDTIIQQAAVTLADHILEEEEE